MSEFNHYDGPNDLGFALDQLFSKGAHTGVPNEPLHRTILGSPEHPYDQRGLSADVAIFVEANEGIPPGEQTAEKVSTIEALGIASYNDGFVVLESHWTRQDGKTLPHECVEGKCLVLHRRHGEAVAAKTAGRNLLRGKHGQQLAQTAEEVGYQTLRNMLEVPYVIPVPESPDDLDDPENNSDFQGRRVNNNLLLAGGRLSPVARLAIKLGGVDGGPFQDLFLKAAVQQKIHEL